MRRPKAEQEPPASDPYSVFIRLEARAKEREGSVPASLRAWDERLARVRAGLARSLGRMPEVPCPLDPEILGVVPRDGYAIERLTFQSRPEVRVTANLYRPEPARGRQPGVLSVHGHWPWARMDPHVQPRCIALAKLGYVVLCVDAFGAGERAVVPAPGTYHGALAGASLWLAGTPLIGLQVYDNRRAVDYLISRQEVDPARLAVTGASGGGNQTLYAGATDERLTAVIPVCGIGTYKAYLSTACCVCEVNSGGVTYATTGDLLAMVAPRALLVISATRDAFQFSVGEAAKSVARARERYRLLGHDARIRHVAIDSGHDYNRPMREAMYGWVEKWLGGRGDGTPVNEPAFALEQITDLRCYPDALSRPKTVVTIPEFAWREGRARLAALPAAPDHAEHWHAESQRMHALLRDQILGGFPERGPFEPISRPRPPATEYQITTEHGITAVGHMSAIPRDARGTALIVYPGPVASGAEVVTEPQLQELEGKWNDAGFATLRITDSRLTASVAANIPPIAGVSDHTPAEWGLWVNRPLLQQWVWDIIRWLDFLDELRVRTSPARAGSRPERSYILLGIGTMSLPVVLAAALDSRVAGATCEGCLVSLVGRTANAWSGVPMGLIAPNMLGLGDIAHFAALVAPRPLVISKAIEPEGGRATPDRVIDAFAFCRAVYRLLGASDRLTLSDLADLREMFPKP
jgi:dienelactone hydrolase